MKSGENDSETIPPLKYFIKKCSKGHRRRGLTVRFFFGNTHVGGWVDGC